MPECAELLKVLLLICTAALYYMLLWALLYAFRMRFVRLWYPSPLDQIPKGEMAQSSAAMRSLDGRCGNVGQVAR